MFGFGEERFREWRLLRQHVSPGENFEEPPEAGSVQQDAEKLRELIAYVEQALTNAAGGHTDLQKLLQNPESRRAILALIKYEKDRGVQWYENSNQIDHETHPAFAEAVKEFEGLLHKAERIVQEYFTTLEKYQRDAGEVLDDVGSSDRTIGMQHAFDVLKAIADDREKVSRRQRAALIVARELVRASGKGLSRDKAQEFIKTLFSDPQRLPLEERKTIADLEAVLTAKIKETVGASEMLNASHVKEQLFPLLQIAADLPPEERSPLRDTVDGLIDDVSTGGTRTELVTRINTFFDGLSKEERVGLLISDRKALSDKALSDIAAADDEKLSAQELDTLIFNLSTILRDRLTVHFGLRETSRKQAMLHEELRRNIIRRFPERARYLYLLAGADTKRLLGKAQRDDYAMDFVTLQELLRAMLQASDDTLEPDAAFGLNTLEKEAHFSDDIDAAALKRMTEQTHLQEETVKTIAEQILTRGKFSYTVDQLAAISSDFDTGKPQDFRDLIVFLYGREIAAKMKKDARSESTADCLSYLRTSLPYLVMDDAAAKAFSSVWSGKTLREHLTNNGFNNPATVDIPGALRRAGLQDSFSDHLEKQKLNVSAGALYLLAKIPEIDDPTQYPLKDAGVKLVDLPGLADQILHYVINRETGEVDRKAVRDIFSFLLAKGTDVPGTSEKTVANAVGIATLLSGGILVERENRLFLAGADSSQRDENRKNLKEEISKKVTVTKDAIQHLKELRKRGYHNLPLREDIKMSLREMFRLARFGTGVWWDYITSVPGNVYDRDNGDAALQDFLDREKQLDAYGGQLKGVLKDFNEKNVSLEKAFDTLYKRDILQHEALRNDIQPVLLSQTMRMNALSPAFLTKQARIDRVLQPLFASQNEEDVRQKARFLANQPGLPVDQAIERAKLYLRDPENFAFSEEEKEWIRRTSAKETRAEILQGKDILDPLRYELHVDVVEKAMDLLRTTKGPDGEENLLVGDTHFDNWLQNPQAAKASLALILYDIPGKEIGGKEALLQAFCTKAEATTTLPDGKKRTIKFGDAQLYVKAIQEHLQRQREDFQQSELQLERKDRFRQPLDYLRAGAESIGKMLSSGDRVQQGIAIAMLVTGGYLLMQTWQKKGLGKKLMVGIPLLFGADIVLRDMTGKGLLQRLGLTYMNAKDRNAAVEQFVRSNEKKEGYEDLGSTAGYEAVTQLMSPKKPFSVTQLLAWRTKARAGGAGAKFSNGAPDGMDVAAKKVSSKLGSIEKNKYKSAERLERSYEILLKTFEALCTDVATANGQSPTIETGMRIIRERYVNFSAKHIQGFKPELEAVAKSRPGGGFSMLDVLVYERPTPAMTAEFLANPTFLEWAFKGAGIPIAWAVEKMKGGWSALRVYTTHFGERAPEVAESAKDTLLAVGESAWDYLRRTTVKLGAEIGDNFAAVGTILQTLGVKVKTHGPDVVEFVMDGTVEITAESVSKLRRLHAFIMKNPEMQAYVKPMEDGVINLIMDPEIELDPVDAEKQIKKEIAAMARFYNGGNYPMGDVRDLNSISTYDLSERSKKISFLSKNGPPLTPEGAEVLIKQHLNTLTGEIYGASPSSPPDYSTLLPARQRNLLEILQANLHRNIAASPQIGEVVAELDRERERLNREITQLSDESSRQAQEAKDAKEELKKIEEEYTFAWKTSASAIDSHETSAKSSFDSKINAQGRKLEEKKALNKVDISLLNLAEKGLHRVKVQSVEKAIQDLAAEANTLNQELTIRIPVYQALARLSPRTAANASNISGLTPDQDRYLRHLIVLDTDYHDIVQRIQDAEHEHQKARTNLQRTQGELDGLEVGVAKIPATQIFTNIQKDIFDLPPADRDKPLSDATFGEPYNAFEALTFGWLLGEAKEKARTMKKKWKKNRLAEDRLYQKFLADGNKPELLASYENYLDHVALGEIFQRGMLQSHDGGKEEKERPLHLSTYEARHLDQYLNERRRLVTFAQFIDSRKSYN